MKKLNKGFKKKVGLVLIALAMVFFVISTDLVSLSMIKSPSALSILPQCVDFIPAPYYGDFEINGKPAPIGTSLIIVPNGGSIEDGFNVPLYNNPECLRSRKALVITEEGKFGGDLQRYGHYEGSYFTIYYSFDNVTWYPVILESVIPKLVDGSEEIINIGLQDIGVNDFENKFKKFNYYDENGVFRKGYASRVRVILSGTSDDAFLHVKHYDCPLKEGYQAMMESFSATDSVNEFSFRYPVNYFCDAFPVVITDNINNVVYKNTSAYADIVNGSTVTVPDGMTYTFTYFTPTPDDLPFVCEVGSLDLETNTCVVTSGLTYLCSTGQFDSATGACVVQPESSIVCETGRYDVSLGLCVWNPPIQAVCEMGLFNANTGNCDYTPLTANVCVEDAIYNETTGKCEMTPVTVVLCEKGIFDEAKNMCVFTPEAEALCGIGSFNELTGVCEYSPDVVGVCVMGEYNIELDRCEYFADTSVLCDEGTYDSVTNTCIVTPPMEIVCGEGNYNPVTLRCEFVPVSVGVCEIGTYDEVNNTCNYVPETNVACEKGVYDPVTNSCLFTPPVENICPVGSVLTDGKCLMELGIESVCPAGSTLSEDGLVCLKELDVVKTCPIPFTLNEAGDDCVALPVAFDESLVFSVLGGISLLGGIVLRGLV